MVGKTNVAGARLRAVIAVTYPEGSVCTCSNGTKTLKARDTSGKALFNVTAGSWTVTATDGNKTKSVTVDIATDGEVENVVLAYDMVLYDAGNECTDITGGWTSSGYTSSRTVKSGTKYDTYMYFPSLSDNNSLYVLGTNNTIQFGKFSKLIISVESSSGVSNDCVITPTKTNFTSNAISYKALVNGENELDISSLESGFIALYTSTKNSPFKVTKVRAV